MKFWTIETVAHGETIGCELSKRAAIKTAASMGYGKDEITTECVEVNVTADAIRRLLGNIGGYAAPEKNA